MVGRTIIGVVLAEAHWGHQAYLFFSDGTSFEVFGQLFQGSSGVGYDNIWWIRDGLVREKVPFEVHTDPAPRLINGTWRGPTTSGIRIRT